MGRNQGEDFGALFGRRIEGARKAGRQWVIPAPPVLTPSRMPLRRINVKVYRP